MRFWCLILLLILFGGFNAASRFRRLYLMRPDLIYYPVDVPVYAFSKWFFYAQTKENYRCLQHADCARVYA